MRSRTVHMLGLVTTLALAGSLAGADEGYRHGRLRFAEPGTTLQRATETEAEEAVQNLPFLPGDRIWTDDAGRAEFQFPDGTLVRLDRRGKMDYAAHEEERVERIVMRLWSGSVIVHAPSSASLRFEVETPAGIVEALEKSVVRVDVDGGDTRVSVYEGEAAFEGVRLALAERALARWGERPDEPERFDRSEADDFLQWDQERESDNRWAANSARYLPEDLDEYSGELERNGDWRYEGGVSGYVWVPQVDVGWQPYSNGRWAWTPYGWTWVPYENWGWAPFHYGRWGRSASLGWYWVPGRTWGPAWVSWAVGGGYAAWCPLGWRDRPVSPWGQWGGAYGSQYGRGRAVPGQVFGRPGGAWNVVRQGELGRGDVRRHRVDVARVDPAVLRAADSPLLRPTRDVASLRPADP
ncbi:MAG TPA: FecR family protein, partial [Coriobacteriia bacterium]